MKKAIPIIIVIVAVAAYFVLHQGEKGVPTKQQPALEHYREVTLYYGASDANGLVAEARRVEISDQLTDNIRRVIDELVSGPRNGGVATIPSSTRIRAVFANQGIAYIDFSRDIVDDFSGGTAAEYTLVSSLVQTIAANFPEIDGVRILVEGEEATTIGGHLYISTVLRPKDWR